VRHTAAGACEEGDLLLIKMDAVRVPHIVAGPAQRFDIFHRPHPEALQTETFFVERLSQVRVQAHAAGAGQAAGLNHQVRGDAKGRARRQRDVYHAEALRLVILFDDAATIAQNGLFILHAVVGRQPATRAAQAHAAARGREAHAQVHGRLDFVVERAAVGVDVEVIARRGAAREHELGQANLRRDIDRLRRQPRPERVESRQPVEQPAVLGDAPGEGLVEVVVRVHQTGQDDHAAGVEHGIGGRRQLAGGACVDDDAILGKKAAIGHAAAVGAHGNEPISVFEKKRGHLCDLVTGHAFKIEPMRSIHSASQ